MNSKYEQTMDADASDKRRATDGRERNIARKSRRLVDRGGNNAGKDNISSFQHPLLTIDLCINLLIH